MTTMNLGERKQQVEKELIAHGQQHLLAFFDDLDEAKQQRLLDQIQTINFPALDGLIEKYVFDRPRFTLPDDLRPAPYYPVRPTEGGLRDKMAIARSEGERLLRQGKVAAFVVAGGSGTRLGYDGPKGTFPAAPVTGKSLFEMFADYLKKAQDKYRTTIPWYVMTSPSNDAATRAFFADNEYFGLDEANVMFFEQGTMPSIGYDGKILLADRDEIALSADGHGGSLKALYRRGAIEDMKRRGIEQISYFQVDNPMVHCVDPLFLGLHALDGAAMSSKMVTKNYGTEKLGNFCLIDGRVTIVEYSDLPDELAEQRDEQGQLRFRSGSPAIHVIRVDFVKELNAEGELNLPFHRADKKVAHIDPATGEHVAPDEPNAVKLEQFVFDALPLCETSIVLETERAEEMAFIKNAEGENSPASSMRDQCDRAGRWLESVGVNVPWGADGHVDAEVEVRYTTAIEPADLKNIDLPQKIEAGGRVVV